MDSIDPIDLLVQLPFVGILLWFMVWSMKFHKEDRVARDKEWREWLSTQNRDNQNFMDKQREAYLNSVRDLTDKLEDHHSTSINHASEMLKLLKAKNSNSNGNNGKNNNED